MDLASPERAKICQLANAAGGYEDAHAGQIVQGTGFGIVGDLLIGIAGALIGSWLLPQVGLHLGSGIVSAIINATIGALLLLLVIRLVRGGGGWHRSWGGSWGRRW
jgi:uncharacterized membrane protein YeaQ/YmgE (transglycosylase-associated protein family)